MTTSSLSSLLQGPVVCTDRVKTIVVDKPVEECALEPIKSCNQVRDLSDKYNLIVSKYFVFAAQVTKLVPKLVPRQECVSVPKEVCARSQTNPRRVKRPVIKKWCYTPSAESGLA